MKNGEVDKVDVLIALMAATKTELHSMIETQTLLQLLVKKEIFSPEEVANTRKLVEKNSKKVQLLQKEYAIQTRLYNQLTGLDSEKDKFMYLLGKMMHDRNSLTEEELNYLDSILDFKKYWDEEPNKE